MKKSAATLAKEQLQKKFKGAGICTMDEGSRSDVTAVIPTGIPVVDNYVIGCGGLPVRRIVEVFGGESAGKTAFVFSCLAAAQKAGYGTILVETEDALDVQRAKLHGVDLNEVLLLTPDSLEEAFAQIGKALEVYADNETPCLIALDSVAATPTQAEVEQGLDLKASMAAKARVISKTMPVLSNLVKKSNATLLLVNQTRSKVGVMFGSPITTPGGAAIKFHASVRLKIARIGAIKKLSQNVGQQVKFTGAKNKVGYPWREVETEYYYDECWDNDWSYLNLAKDLGLMDKGTRKSPSNCKEALSLLEENNWKSVKKDKKEDKDEPRESKDS